MTAATDTKTAEVIAEMLTENTGRSMLDSGDYYGRHYEKNAGKVLADFESEPQAWASSYGVTLSAFHYLTARVKYDDSLNAEWDSFCSHNADDGHFSLMQDFANERDSSAHTWNTYNGDDSLSQTLQGVTFAIGERVYALIQIHGGCDVRGGYTRPRAFRIEMSDASYFPCDNDSYHVTCDSGEETHGLSWYGEWISWEGSCADDSSYPEYTGEGMKCAQCGAGMTVHAPEPY